MLHKTTSQSAEKYKYPLAFSSLYGCLAYVLATGPVSVCRARFGCNASLLNSGRSFHKLSRWGERKGGGGCAHWRTWCLNLSCSWILGKALFLLQIENRAEAGLYSASLGCQVCVSCLLEAGSLAGSLQLQLQLQLGLCVLFLLEIILLYRFWGRMGSSVSVGCLRKSG